MIKLEMLESINIIQQILEGDFKEVNKQQEEELHKQFNKYLSFQYINDGGYIFLMDSDTFKDFKYYLGMGYELSETCINMDDNVLVTYDYDCVRAKELFELLKEFE